MPVVLQSPPRAEISPPGGAVRVGTGSRAITLPAPSSLALVAPGGRVTVSPVPRIAVVGARQGIAGPPGPGSEIEIYSAAVTIGGHRAVALDESGELIYASSSLSIPAFGLVRDAVTAGDEVAVYRAGRVGGFTGLTTGETYYLAATGTLSLTPPTSGVLQPLGIAASATELLVDPDYPTFL